MPVRRSHRSAWRLLIRFPHVRALTQPSRSDLHRPLALTSAARELLPPPRAGELQQEQRSERARRRTFLATPRRRWRLAQLIEEYFSHGPHQSRGNAVPTDILYEVEDKCEEIRARLLAGGAPDNKRTKKRARDEAIDDVAKSHNVQAETVKRRMYKAAKWEREQGEAPWAEAPGDRQDVKAEALRKRGAKKARAKSDRHG